MSTGIQVGDVGTGIIIIIKELIVRSYVPVDISGQVNMCYFFKKPNNAVVSVTPEFRTDGKDGALIFRTPIDFIDVAGKWFVQAEITLPGGHWRSNVVEFTVFENL